MFFFFFKKSHFFKTVFPYYVNTCPRHNFGGNQQTKIVLNRDLLLTDDVIDLEKYEFNSFKFTGYFMQISSCHREIFFLMVKIAKHLYFNKFFQSISIRDASNIWYLTMLLNIQLCQISKYSAELNIYYFF